MAATRRERAGEPRNASLPRNQSLVRGAELLRALANRPRGASVAELARAVELPRTTVTRLLATLAEIGFAERIDSSWIVGREVMRLGRAADPFRLLIDVARPLLENLAIDVEESALLQVVTIGWDAQVIVQVDPPKLVATTNWLDRRFSGELHASSIGKLALAALPDDLVPSRLLRPLPAYTPKTITDVEKLLVELRRVRRVGFAETVDELEEGLTALSVPLDDPPLRETAGVRAISIGVTGTSARLSPAKRKAILPVVVACRDEIAKRLAAPTLP